MFAVQVYARGESICLFFFIYQQTWWRRDVTHLSSSGYHLSERQAVKVFISAF